MRATIGCSTGFKVTRPDGTKMMLTARHCTGGNPGYLYNTPAGQNMGQSTDWAVYNFDVTGIRGRGYTLTSWLGPWVQPGQHEERIGGGARHYYLGEILIFSGSYSGQHSGQISKLRTRWRPNSTAPWHRDFLGVKGTRDSAPAGQGDSGGPVLIKKPNTWIAAGIISAGSNPGKCFGAQSRTCYKYQFVSPWIRFGHAAGLGLG